MYTYICIEICGPNSFPIQQFKVYLRHMIHLTTLGMRDHDIGTISRESVVKGSSYSRASAQDSATIDVLSWLPPIAGPGGIPHCRVFKRSLEAHPESAVCM